MQIFWYFGKFFCFKVDVFFIDKIVLCLRIAFTKAGFILILVIPAFVKAILKFYTTKKLFSVLCLLKPWLNYVIKKMFNLLKVQLWQFNKQNYCNGKTVFTIERIIC